MIKLLSAIFLFHFKINWSLVRYDLCLLLQGFNRFSKFLIQNRICIVVSFCWVFPLASFNFLTSLFRSRGLNFLLDTETALATGLASGAFQLLLLDLQLLQFWLCFCNYHLFFSCFCFAI